jgi:hypothetical protein
MSDHDDVICPVNLMLPASLSTLAHIHTFHSDREITSYTGQGSVDNDIYIISGSSREKVRAFIDSLKQKSCEDVSELDRMFNLKPSRKGSASGTARESRSTTPKKRATS